jgi:hypothetical protein
LPVILDGNPDGVVAPALAVDLFPHAPLPFLLHYLINEPGYLKFGPQILGLNRIFVIGCGKSIFNQGKFFCMLTYQGDCFILADSAQIVTRHKCPSRKSIPGQQVLAGKQRTASNQTEDDHNSTNQDISARDRQPIPLPN